MVDWERREVVDVLPDRSAETTAQWLRQHPEIEIISRDRCGLSAQGAKEGAPQARPVADRFHLLQNLRLAMERQLSCHPHSFPAAASQERNSTDQALSLNHHHQERQPELAQHRVLARQGHRAVWQEHFDRVKRLSQEGKSRRAIVTETGLNGRTVTKWISWEKLPERRRMNPKATTPRKFESYLAKRWEEGFRTARHLLPELQQRGYTGSQTHRERLLTEWRRAGGRPSEPILSYQEESGVCLESPPVPPIPASYLCLKPRGLLTEQERDTVSQLKETRAGFTLMRQLAMRFRGLLRGRDASKLAGWLDAAHRSGLYGLRRFAYTIRRDLAAVENAIREHWSNGQTEGHMHRLKMRKRQM